MPHFSGWLDIDSQYSHVNKEGAKSGDDDIGELFPDLFLQFLDQAFARAVCTSEQTAPNVRIAP